MSTVWGQKVGATALVITHDLEMLLMYSWFEYLVLNRCLTLLIQCCPHLFRQRISLSVPCHTHTHTYTSNFSQTRKHRCPKKNASWSMMVFIAVCCLKLGLDILVQKLENIKDFGTLRIHIWLFLSIGSLSTESTNNKSEVFEKKFQKVSKKQNLNFPCTWQILGLPQWLSGKESTCNAGDAGDAGLIPDSGRSGGGRNGNLFQYFFQENPMVRGAWQAIVHGVAKSQT